MSAPQNNPEQISDNAPLPIGCAPLDSKEQRMWDNFMRQGLERDRQHEEERQRLKAEAELKAKQPENPTSQPQPQPQAQKKRDAEPLTLMQQFQRNLDMQRMPKTAKKLNLAPSQIEVLLTEAYIKECLDRNVAIDLKNDKYTPWIISHVSRWLAAETHAKGSLLLRGNVGVGKTTMLRAIRMLFIGLGLPSMTIKSAYEINELAKDKSSFDMLKAAEFLGIDDLGTEPSTIKDWGNERSPFEELISARYDRLKQTLITTNLVVVNGDDQIETRYSSRIADRLREMCNTINYDPNQESYRK